MAAEEDFRPWSEELSLNRPRHPPVPRPRPPRMLGYVVVSVLAAYCWLVSSFAPFSTKSLVGVLLPGAVLGVIAYGHPPRRIPPPERMDAVGFSYWVIAITALFEWEASAFRAADTTAAGWAHPPLTTLVDAVISPHPMKAAAFGVWLAVGWGLVKR